MDAKGKDGPPQAAATVKIGVVLPAIITAVFAGLVALGQMWANYQLDRIHRLTNTNFSEQKAVISEQARRIDGLLAAIDRLSASGRQGPDRKPAAGTESR